MHPILRNILAILSGIVVGGTINMGLITISGHIIPPPEGADVTIAEGLQASIHLFEPRHFIMPFLAHTLGAFSGALVTALLAGTRKRMLAMVIAVFNLAGGIGAVMMIPAPLWFDITDLTLA